MKVIYTGPHDAVDLPTLRTQAVRDGDPIDVPDKVAKHLIDRGDFRAAKPATPSRAAS